MKCQCPQGYPEVRDTAVVISTPYDGVLSRPRLKVRAHHSPCDLSDEVIGWHLA